MKKMRFLAVVVAMLMLSSCGAKTDTSAGSASASSMGELAAGDNNMSTGMLAAETARDNGKVMIEMEGGESVMTPITTSAGSSLQAVAVSEKKIIKNGNVDIEADDVLESYKKLLDYVISLGGYEFSQSLSNYSEYASLNATLKVPPDKLDAVLEYAQECGKVINVNTAMNDITMSYTDTELRLENKKKNLEKYYEYYEKATTMEELIAIQTQIDNITAEIESYEGQLKYWNAQIDESVLSVYIKEAADPNKISEDIDWSSLSLSSMGKLIRNGFMAVINGIVAFFQWVIIAIVSLSPAFIVAGVIVYLIIKKRKMDRAKNLPKSPATGNPDTEKKI